MQILVSSKVVFTLSHSPFNMYNQPWYKEYNIYKRSATDFRSHDKF